MRLTKNQATYVLRLWKEHRHANKMAEKFSSEWNKLNDEINTKLDSEGDTDIASRTKVKAQSIPLSDAYAAGQWWANEARRLAAAIHVEYIATTMMRGGVAWEEPESRPSYF